MTRSWRDDDAVREALRERAPSEVLLLECPDCEEYSYWGEGSSFCCRLCGGIYAIASDGEEAEAFADLGERFILAADEMTSVADLIDAEEAE